MSDADFATRILAVGLGIRHATVGFDFTYGKGRTGSPEALARIGRQLGFSVSVTERVDDVGGLKLSSSAVREALNAGDMTRAAAITHATTRVVAAFTSVPITLRRDV